MRNTKQVGELVEVRSRLDTVNAVVEQIQSDFSSSFVTGESGCGKTTLAQQIERDCRHSFVLLSFTHPVSSYQEFIKTIASALQCTVEDVEEEKEVQQLSLQCITKLKAGTEKLLLIFDESHSIYLATLERILRFQNELVEYGAKIHLVFIGKPALNEMYEKLVAGKNVASTPLNINLAPLSKEECGTFFIDLVKRDEPSFNYQDVSSEFFEQLYSVTKGNMGKIDQVAEKAEKNEQDDTAFFSLLNDIEETDQKKKRKPVAKGRKKESSKKRRLFGLLLMSLTFVSIFFFFKNEQQISQSVEQKKVQNKTVVEARSLEGTTKEAPEVEKTVQTVIEKTVKAETVVKEAVEVVAEDVKFVTNKLENDETSKSDTDQPLAEDIEENVKSEKLVKEVTDEAVLEPEKQIKITANPDNKKLSAEQIYKNRATATAKWLDKRDNKFFTMQLMALTSDKSQAHLHAFLDKEEYRSEAENFYFLRKTEAPQTLYVFYGEYASKEAASEAREVLPAFLKKQNPYSITIDDALKKAGL